ncbi:MAG: phosphonate ABC transporter, permease protein PhnE [bacterium]
MKEIFGRTGKFLLFLFLLLFLLYAMRETEVSVWRLISGSPWLFRLLISFLTPNISGEWVMQTLNGVWETLMIAYTGTLISGLISVPLSFLGARNIMTGSWLRLGVYTLMRLFFTFFRSLDALILGILFVVAVGIGPFAGVLALIVHTCGVLGKMFSEAIEESDPKIIEAIRSTGATDIQVVSFAILPRVFPYFLSFFFLRLDTNVRMSTALGLLGAGGIGYLLKQSADLLDYHKTATIVWEIILLISFFDFLSGYVRRRIRSE